MPMRAFTIYKEGLEEPVGRITYDVFQAEHLRWHAELFGEHGLKNGPLVFRINCECNDTTVVEPRIAFRWVCDRTMPPDRQCMGPVLRSLGLTYYSRFGIFAALKGRCYGDSFYVVEEEGIEATSGEDTEQ